MPPTPVAQSNHMPPGPLQQPPSQPGMQGGYPPQQNGEGTASEQKIRAALSSLCYSAVLFSLGAFGQVRGPQPGYAGPYPGQPNYGAPAPAPAPAPPAQKRLDPDAIPSPVRKDTYSIALGISEFQSFVSTCVV